MIGNSVSKTFSGTNKIELPTWLRVSVTTIAASRHAMCSMYAHTATIYYTVHLQYSQVCSVTRF